MKILLSGEGGQGVQIMAKILSQAAYKQKYNVIMMPHYGVEMRMGISIAYIQISEKKLTYPKFEKADILVAMTPRDINTTKQFIRWGTNVINGMNLEEIAKENHIPRKSINMIVLGILCKEFKNKLPLDTGIVKEMIKKYLGKKKGLQKNLDAFMKGINLEQKYYNKSINSYPKRDLRPTRICSKQKDWHHWPENCKGCGLCIEKCPVGALSWSKDKVNYFGAPIPVVDIDKCIACGICEQICPDMAIRVVKKK